MFRRVDLRFAQDAFFAAPLPHQGQPADALRVARQRAPHRAAFIIDQQPVRIGLAVVDPERSRHAAQRAVCERDAEHRVVGGRSSGRNPALHDTAIDRFAAQLHQIVDTVDAQPEQRRGGTAGRIVHPAAVGLFVIAGVSLPEGADRFAEVELPAPLHDQALVGSRFGAWRVQVKHQLPAPGQLQNLRRGFRVVLEGLGRHHRLAGAQDRADQLRPAVRRRIKSDSFNALIHQNLVEIAVDPRPRFRRAPRAPFRVGIADPGQFDIGGTARPPQFIHNMPAESQAGHRKSDTCILHDNHRMLFFQCPIDNYDTRYGKKQTVIVKIFKKSDIQTQKYQNNCLIHTCNPPKTGYIGDSGIAYSALQAGSTRTESGIK